MRKIMIMTAALAGFVAASNAAVTAINYDGADAYDAGAYELLTGDSSNIAYSQSLNGYRGQTITVTNDFDLGAISIIYATTVQDVIVSNLVVHVYEVADPLAASYVVPPASTLFSGTFDASASTGSDTLYLALGTNISLFAGSYYMIMFEDANASANNVFRWRRSTSSSGADFYPGGLKVNQDGSVEAVRDFSLGLGLAPPLTANDDAYSLPYGVSGTTNDAPGVLANDLSYDYAVLVTDISSGSLTFNADGSFDCSGLVNGSNTFAYAAVSGSVTSAPATVLLFTTLEADIPIAVDDTFVMDLAYGDHIEGNVLNNDTNTSATLEMFAVLDSYTSGNGTLTLSADGAFVYTPNGGFSGTDTFTYKAYTVVATSEVATVTLNVEESTPPGTVIESFETYDNSASTTVKDIPAAALNWDPNNSGQITIQNRGGNGPSYQYLKVGWDSRYRGAISIGDLFAGIPDSSTEYWLYCELYPTATAIDGCFGVTVNPAHSVASTERGDFTAGVRLSGDGSTTNLDLYAFTGGVASNDVLLTSGLEVNAWHGIWLNINNAANTYDVYVGDAGDASNRGTKVGSDIDFVGEGDLVSLLASSTRTMYVDDIMNVDPESFFINFPAILYGSSPAAFDTLELNIGLNDRANTADYWPVSSGNLVVGGFVPVAHSDAPDGTFAITNLNLASGDQTNKVIYVKATDNVEFFRIENNQ